MKKTLSHLLRLAPLMAVLYTVTIGILYMATTSNHTAPSEPSRLRIIMLCMMLPIMLKFVIQLTSAPIYAWLESWRDRKQTALQVPTVSVCIPAWNEEVGILKTLQSVLKTNYPALEVLIINDGSTDSTHEQVTRFLTDYSQTADQSATLKYLQLENGGKANALNQALKQATGEIVITVDADSVMDSQAIMKLVKRFNDPKVAAVAGNVIISNKKKPIELMQQMEYVYGFFFKRGDALFNSVYIIGGAAAAYRRDVLDVVGGFDHKIITEDIEMSTRILAHGYKTRYAPDAVVYTEGPSDLKGLGHQRLRWKYGRILTFLKHRKLFFSLRKKHNPYLTCLILPMAVYAEVLLLLEAAMLAAFFIYTVQTHDYMPLAFIIVLLTSIISLQVLVDSKRHVHRNLLLVAPVAWLLFYAIDLIEFQALIRALKRLAKGKDLKWQKWVRVGIIQDTGKQPPTLPNLSNEIN